MREGISAGDLTLLLGSGLRFFRVRVRRPEEAIWTNLSDLDGGDWVLRIRSEGENPDQSASQFTFSLVHTVAGDSLAPGMSTSPHNIDAAVTFRPLIHPGRHVEISVAVIAGGTPSGGDWKPWLRGQIEDVDWPGNEVTASCMTLDAMLLQTRIEVEEKIGDADDPWTLEATIQYLLDRWLGTGTVPLRVIGTPGAIVPRGPYEEGSLGSAILALAQQIGWDVRYRWSQAAGDFRLTLYEPPRDKTTPDLTLLASQIYQVAGLKESRQYVRNRFRVAYRDSTSQRREVMTGEDATSIAEYGPQFLPMIEGDDSSIDSAARATALIDFAKSDLAFPPVDGRYAIPFIPWLELGDLIEIEADDQHFDYDENMAVVGLAHEVDGDSGASSTFDGRGKQPIGMVMGWFRRRRPLEPGASDQIQNFREISRTPTEITYAWKLGSALASSWIHNYQEKQPYSEDKWPNEARLPESVSDDREVEFTVTIPEQGFVGYLQVEGRRADGDITDMERVLIFPTNTPGDYIAFAAITVDQTDGSAVITGWTTERAQSVAYAFNVGPAATTDPPTEAQGEAYGAGADGGGLVTGFTSDFTITLPAGTVDPGEVIKVLLIAYMDASGIGPDGTAQDHDTPVGVQGERFKITLSSQLETGVVISDKLQAGAQSMITDIVFSATDWDTVAWSAGTVQLAGGGSYAIAAGNTGNLASAAARYVYLEPTVSPTVLQVTTATTGALGDGKILLAAVWRAPVSDQLALFVPVVGGFGINETVIGPNSIKTSHLQALSVTTVNLAAGAVTAAKATIAYLASLHVDAGRLTAGYLSNGSNTAALKLSASTNDPAGIPSLPATNFIDFTATGANPFIKHAGLELLANGDATFSGSVTADAFFSTAGLTVRDQDGATSPAVYRQSSITLNDLVVGTIEIRAVFSVVTGLEFRDANFYRFLAPLIVDSGFGAKQIEEDADDTAGVGYRRLRVPN